MQRYVFLYTTVFMMAVSTYTAKGQNPDIKRTYHWYFGYGAGLDFSTGTPVNDDISNYLLYEGTAVVSDTCGNLLFYTDGRIVWNKNHQPMPNGTGLMGGFGSSAQAALIVPSPLSEKTYYIFTADQAGNFGAMGFRYSVVDISLDGGLGDITIKNVLLFSPAMEKIAATYHNNSMYVWVVGRALYSPNLYAYLVTDTGIITSPVISSVGASAESFVLGDGCMRFSYDGGMLASAIHTLGSDDYDTLDVYHFDNTTGSITKFVSLNFGIPGEVYGICFSPDNSKLYSTMFTSTPSYSTNIYQFDLSSGIPAIIQSSQTLIDSSSSYDYWFGQIQLRPDDKKLYVTQDDSSWSLATINYPNLTGSSSGFTLNDFTLTKPIAAGLPNFIDSYLNGNWTPMCINSIFEYTEKNILHIFPNPFSQLATVELQNILTENTEMKVYNSIGQEVRQKTIYKGVDKFFLERKNISEGIYLLTLNIHGKIFSQKFIINL